MFHPPNGELTDFLPWQWARGARLTGQKVRSNDWFAPQSGAGQSGGLTQSGNSRVRTAKRCERQGSAGAISDPLEPFVKPYFISLSSESISTPQNGQYLIFLEMDKGLP